MSDFSRALLIHVDFSQHDDNYDVNEFIHLAQSAGIKHTKIFKLMRKKPDVRLFIGSGKAEEIKSLVSDFDLIIFNNSLSPSQGRNLQEFFDIRVLDRTELILDIFAQRARSFEGKLQVELAQLQHLSTRLVRRWTHLERQKGGIGLRGPGEAQLEMDKRLLKQRIKRIKTQLVKVGEQRIQSRSVRKKRDVPVVALVGYTNAGKSTLFNALTSAKVYTSNALFATLDSILRKINLPNGSRAVVVDTVGFIRNLPHDLIESFKSTLEEILESCLIVHVVDVAREDKQLLIKKVNEVLKIIAADHIPQLLVFNKIDLLDNVDAQMDLNKYEHMDKSWVSAHSSLGIDNLKSKIEQHLFGDPVYRNIFLTPVKGHIRSMLYKRGVVIKERSDILGNYVLTVKMMKAEYNKICLEVDKDVD